MTNPKYGCIIGVEERDDSANPEARKGGTVIFIHTEKGIIYLVQEDDGAVKVYEQERNKLLAEGEQVQIAYGEVSLAIGGDVVWKARIVS